MAQHALGLGLIGGCNREVVALQRCKRYMAQHALGLGLIGGCNREVVALLYRGVRGMAQHALGLGLTYLLHL